MAFWNLQLPKDMNHGDWKTAAAFPNRYPALKAGTVVQAFDVLHNFYGVYLRCTAPDGTIYDLESYDFGIEGSKVIKAIKEAKGVYE